MFDLHGSGGSAGRKPTLGWSDVKHAIGIELKQVAPKAVNQCLKGWTVSDRTWHCVVSDPEAAAGWYRDVLDAVEVPRIALPDGSILSIDLRFAHRRRDVAGQPPRAAVRPFGSLSSERAIACAALVHEDGDRADCRSQPVTQDEQTAHEGAELAVGAPDGRSAASP